MAGFGKLFSTAYTGSMMGAGPNNFAVWGYALANADADGIVELNPKFLSAVIGRLTPADVADTIKYLCSPDPESRSPDEDGRRIVHIEGFSYRIVNYRKYRAARDDNERREQNRQSQQRFRETHKSKPPSAKISHGNQRKPPSAQAEAEAEAEAENSSCDSGEPRKQQIQKKSKPKAEPKPRERNELIDAMVAVDGSNPLEVTGNAWGRAGIALQQIREVSPDVTPDDIRKRAANYRLHFPKAACTPTGIATHWAACANPPRDGPPNGKPTMSDDDVLKLLEEHQRNDKSRVRGLATPR
jgi:hypothetical protein